MGAEKTEVFVQKRVIEAEKLGAMDGGKPLVGSPKTLEFVRKLLHGAQGRALPSNLGAVSGGIL